MSRGLLNALEDRDRISGLLHEIRELNAKIKKLGDQYLAELPAEIGSELYTPIQTVELAVLELEQLVEEARGEVIALYFDSAGELLDDEPAPSS